MENIARKKIAPIALPKADASAARRWKVETPSGCVEVVADQYDIDRSGALMFLDAPFGELDGRRVLLCVFGPSGWGRLTPPPPDWEFYDDDDAAAAASAAASSAQS